MIQVAEKQPLRRGRPHKLKVISIFSFQPQQQMKTSLLPKMPIAFVMLECNLKATVLMPRSCLVETLYRLHHQLA